MTDDSTDDEAESEGEDEDEQGQYGGTEDKEPTTTIDEDDEE
ncbi:hypothetical protein [Halopiger aswanensis]|nr:hypothetical protein [Halopiger aswanensis]